MNYNLGGYTLTPHHPHHTHPHPPVDTLPEANGVSGVSGGGMDPSLYRFITHGNQSTSHEAHHTQSTVSSPVGSHETPVMDTSLSPRSEASSIEAETVTSRYPDYCKTMIVKDANGQVKELVFPKSLDLDRPKRARTTFSPDQLYKLEREFQRNQYLVGRERTDLSKTLKLSETQVKVWFQNRRTKYKRDKDKEAETASLSVPSMGHGTGDSLANAHHDIMKILNGRPTLSMNTPPSLPTVSLPSIAAPHPHHHHHHHHPHLPPAYPPHPHPAMAGAQYPMSFPVMPGSHHSMFTAPQQYLSRS